MPATSIHDVIVVGTDLAGLMAAGLLRRRRYSVMLVGQGGLGNRYEHEGLSIPALPWTLPLRGQAPLLDEVLDDLAVEDQVHQLGVHEDTHLQVITPNQRIDLFQEPDALAGELARAVPDQKQAFLDAVDGLRRVDEEFREILSRRPPLPPDGFRERSRLKRLVGSTPGLVVRGKGSEPLDDSRWPPLLNILGRATTFLSHLDVASRSPAATAHMILTLLAGLRAVPDLADRLVTAVGKAGADVEIQMVAEHLLLEGKTVTGLQELRSAKTYRCGVMLAGLPLAEAVELIPPAMRRQRARLAADALRPSQSVFTVNLILPAEALPAGMGHNLFLARKPDEPLEEDNLIRIACLPFPERSERVQVCVSCIVPYRKRSLGREYLGPLQRHMMAAAAWLIPFIQDHLESRSSPFWDSRAGDAGHSSPWILHRTIETLEPAALGIAVHPPRTALRNLLLCGPEVVPGLGPEGEALTALQAVRWLENNRKLKKIL